MCYFGYFGRFDPKFEKIFLRDIAVFSKIGGLGQRKAENVLKFSLAPKDLSTLNQRFLRFMLARLLLKLTCENLIFIQRKICFITFFVMIYFSVVTINDSGGIFDSAGS